MGESALLNMIPSWAHALIAIPALGMLFFVKPGVNAYTAWRKGRAEARQTDAETDMKLIEEYKALLAEFKSTVAEQKKENQKLRQDNQRLREATNKLIAEAERLHDFVKNCLGQLHDLGVPTGEIPEVPELEIPRRNSK